MKKYIYTLILTVIVSVSSFAQDGKPQYFGEKIDEKGAMTTTKFVAAMEDKESMDAKVTGKIEAVCQKKGCWMDFDLGNGTMMKVRFKDYEFFVPKDANGKTAVIQGKAKVETIDVATLRHYAEDAGKSEAEIAAITQPEKSISFEASGVIIK